MEKAKAPNYLYPLATQRTLQWTKDTVRGEQSAKKPIKIKPANIVKKSIIKDVIKGKKNSIPFGKIAKTRNFIRDKKMNLPEDPMSTPDPRPGNAMHITNTETAYRMQQN